MSHNNLFGDRKSHFGSFTKSDAITLSTLISSSETLQLISKMTSITNRIDVSAAKKIFDELRFGHKIKLPNNLMNFINAIIEKNINITTEEYSDELSDIRLVKWILVKRLLKYDRDFNARLSVNWCATKFPKQLKILNEYSIKVLMDRIPSLQKKSMTKVKYNFCTSKYM